MSGATSDVGEAMSTARTIRRFTGAPVDDATLERCLQAAMWAPSGANAQAWRFVVLRSPEQRAVVAKAAARALEVIEPVYGMSRPSDDDGSRRARTNRATYELHDRAGEFTSVLFAQKHFPTASELLLGGSIFPAMQNFLLAARAQGLGACLTSWGAYGGEQLLRDAVGVPDDWMLAGHIVVGWPKGRHGPVRRRPLSEVVNLDHWEGGTERVRGPKTERRTNLSTSKRHDDQWGPRLSAVGQAISRYGLALTLAWIGFGKYIKMEARVLIEHSPLMSWVYDVFSANTVARGLGTLEIVAAILIAARPVSARLSAIGSAMAIVLFCGTLSFLFTTPGVVSRFAGPVPVLSALPGQFLLKDVVLLGVAVWTLGEAVQAHRASSAFDADREQVGDSPRP